MKPDNIRKTKQKYTFTYRVSVFQTLTTQDNSLIDLLLAQLPLEFNQDTNFNLNK